VRRHKTRASPRHVALQQIAADVLDIFRASFLPFDLSEDMTVHTIRGFRSIAHGEGRYDSCKGLIPNCL